MTAQANPLRRYFNRWLKMVLEKERVLNAIREGSEDGAEYVHLTNTWNENSTGYMYLIP
jgi:hypothetical protein